MSIAVMTSSTAFSKVRTSKVSSSRRKVIKLSEARLHEELSRCMYSEHGFEAVMRPASGLVCQSLIVLSYCRPGSAHSQAAVEILRNSSRASMVATTEPSARARSPKAPPSSTACMNSSLTRTELLAFWYCTDTMSLPPRSMSNPASRSARILSSSRALVRTNSSMSGWSTSRTTIFAARRVAPPDLMVPADASGLRVGQDDAVYELLEAPLPDWGADRPAEVLGRDDGARVHRPRRRELHALLFEDGLPGPPVGLHDVAAFPLDVVVGVRARRREDPFDRQARLARLRCAAGTRLAGAGRLRHVLLLHVPRISHRRPGRKCCGRPRGPPTVCEMPSRASSPTVRTVRSTTKGA